MTQFDGEDFGKARVDQLKSFIGRLERKGIDMSIADRFLRSGEWGLAFREVYCAAVADGGAYREMEVELGPMNNFLAKYRYYAVQLGYPLS